MWISEFFIENLERNPPTADGRFSRVRNGQQNALFLVARRDEGGRGCFTGTNSSVQRSAAFVFIMSLFHFCAPQIKADILLFKDAKRFAGVSGTTFPLSPCSASASMP